MSFHELSSQVGAVRWFGDGGFLYLTVTVMCYDVIMSAL